MKRHSVFDQQLKIIPVTRPGRASSKMRLLVGLSFLMIALTTGTLVFSVTLLGSDSPPIGDTPKSETTTSARESLTVVTQAPGEREETQASLGELDNWAYRQDKFMTLVMRDADEQACDLPAETSGTVAPESEATPSATPYPQIFDANGILQEGMPVEDFNIDNTVFYVESNKANMRELPNTSAAVTDRLIRGDRVTRLGYGLDWSRIETESGKTGYIRTSLITTEFVAKPTPAPTATPKPTAAPTAIPTAVPSPTAAPTAVPTAAPAPTAVPGPTVTPAPAGSTLTDEQKQAIIDLARAQVGIRYVYAKMDPAVGFDCSGLTSYIYKTIFNIKLPRSARDQATYGLEVSVADIQVGDIICFDYNEPFGYSDHVGIYIGNGRYIHASSSDRTYYSDSGAVKEVAIDFAKKPVISIRRVIY